MPAGINLGQLWATFQLYDDVSPGLDQINQNFAQAEQAADSYAKKVGTGSAGSKLTVSGLSG